MILEALFLATVLGGEKLSEISARNYVEKCKNDEELQRQEFFEDQKRHWYDNFAFFYEYTELQWNKILEMLDLIDEGYFPISVDICTKNKSSREYDIRHRRIENYECKEVEQDEGYYTKFYLKLSDAEDYLDRGNEFYGYNKIAKKEYINLMKRKEVLISDQFLPSRMRLCTTDVARKFMSDVMEEKFQRYWAEMRK